MGRLESLSRWDEEFRRAIWKKQKKVTAQIDQIAVIFTERVHQFLSIPLAITSQRDY